MNISSTLNKLQSFGNWVKWNVDILMISESEINDNFPFLNFLIYGFSTPYRSDRESKSGGIMLFLGQITIRSTCNRNKRTEDLYIELNSRNDE